MIAAGLLAALFAPSSQTVTRSIKIEAPQKVVFSQIANFKKWPKWDSWYAKDTNQIRTYDGTVGEKEYGYSWSSKNKDIGKGKTEATRIEGMERMEFVFHLNLAGKEQAYNGHFQLEENNGVTEVEWVVVSNLSYPSKAMNYFIDGMMGSDFEKSLSNLKNLIESPDFDDISTADQAVQITEEYGVNYALIKRDDLPMNEMEKFFKDGYKEIYTYMQTNGLSPTGDARGLYYQWNEENGLTTLAAAVPISKISNDAGAPVNLELGESFLTKDYISCKISGSYSESYNAHIALGKWMDDNNKELQSPVVEEYLVGPRQTSDTSLFVTKITYFYK
jgi:effector-binding domain-containing protein